LKFTYADFSNASPASPSNPTPSISKLDGSGVPGGGPDALISSKMVWPVSPGRSATFTKISRELNEFLDASNPVYVLLASRVTLEKCQPRLQS